MSDDIKSGDDLSTIVIKLQNRISELEASLEVKYENETGHALYHKDKLEPRISELEENIAGIRRHAIELEKKADDNHVDMMSNHKEIHILREELNAVDKIQDRNWKERGKEIDELNREEKTSLNIALKNREVLRDIINDIFGDEKIKKLLTKLDSQGKTEKKEITDTDYKDPYITLQKEAFDDSDEFPFEDLGGEKAFKAGRRGSGDVHILDSKPPEPITWGDYNAPAGGKITIPESLRREAIEAGNIRLPEPKYIREADGAKLIEPREDDDLKIVMKLFEQKFYKDHILVKREDLDFLYEYCNDQGIYDERLQTVFWDELKRIKEEYNL